MTLDDTEAVTDNLGGFFVRKIKEQILAYIQGETDGNINTAAND